MNRPTSEHEEHALEPEKLVEELVDYMWYIHLELREMRNVSRL